MKMTLLEYVVDILNDMDGDLVNSIDDTFESEQVAQIVKSTYFAILSNRNWPHMRRALQIESSGTSSLPTHMYVQESVKELISINYNCSRHGEDRKLFKPMRWLDPDNFLRKLNGNNNTNPNVDTIQDPSGVELMVRNDTPPTYFTSFDDQNLVFDSYDRAVDDTLQTSKVQAQGYVNPEWLHEDDYIPDLPAEAVTALLESAKSRAMFKLKQMQDLKSEQEANRQQRWLSRKAWRVNGGINYPNYGRKSRKYRRDPTFGDG